MKPTRYSSRTSVRPLHPSLRIGQYHADSASRALPHVRHGDGRPSVNSRHRLCAPGGVHLEHERRSGPTGAASHAPPSIDLNPRRSAGAGRCKRVGSARHQHRGKRAAGATGIRSCATSAHERHLMPSLASAGDAAANGSCGAAAILGGHVRVTLARATPVDANRRDDHALPLPARHRSLGTTASDSTTRRNPIHFNGMHSRLIAGRQSRAGVSTISVHPRVTRTAAFTHPLSICYIQAAKRQ